MYGHSLTLPSAYNSIAKQDAVNTSTVSKHLRTTTKEQNKPTAEAPGLSINKLHKDINTNEGLETFRLHL